MGRAEERIQARLHPEHGVPHGVADAADGEHDDAVHRDAMGPRCCVEEAA